MYKQTKTEAEVLEQKWEDFCKEATGEIRYRSTANYMFLCLMQNCEDARKSLAAALLEVPKESIVRCEVLNTTVPGTYAGEKLIVFDVLMLVNEVRRLNIEMQLGHMEEWESRSLFYGCKGYTADIKEGMNYQEVKPFTQVAILRDRMPGGEEKFYAKYRLVNQETQHVYSDRLEIRILNLRDVDKASEEEKASALYRWAMFFLAETWEDVIMNAEKIPDMEELKKAAMELRRLQSNRAVREYLDMQERYEADIASEKASAQSRGEREGMRKGMSKGMKEKSRAVAAKMLADNEPIEKIMRYSELPEEEILMIREDGPHYDE